MKLFWKSYFIFLLGIYYSNKLVDGHQSSNLTFFVLGDWGGLPTSPYHTDRECGIAKEINQLSEKYSPKFILALGDNFYFDGVNDVNDPRFFETYESVFNASHPPVPWYVIAGNHDWHGNIQGQIEYSKKSPRWNFPDLFYSLNYSISSGKAGQHTSVGIVMIDTVVLCGNSGYDWVLTQPAGPQNSDFADKGWSWIETQLKLFQTYDYVLVAGHYPVWSVAEHGPTDCLVQRLLPMLKTYSVTAYLSGHDHNLQHISTPLPSGAPLEFFVVGAANFLEDNRSHTSAVPPDSLKFFWAEDGSAGGMAYAVVTSDNLSLSMVDTNGKKLYTVDMPPRVKQL